ncbi:MAG TPA: 30S ribosomal protein S4 [Candidatus Paceibacterota bacterium]
MITGPKYKICRRLGPGVYEKCQTQKFTISEASRGKVRRGKAMSDYGLQLLDKQRIRFSYGLSERQFARYVKESMASHGSAADHLFAKIETRLDNVIYRLGIAHTRALARQMVTHGHFTVNDKRVNIPSFTVRPNDKISIREGSLNKTLFQDLAKKLKGHVNPLWLKFDVEKNVALVSGHPKIAGEALNFPAVIEFYSR